MPASYPASVYSPRTKTNKTGVVYEPTAATRLFAEDVSKLDDEVVAIENELGGNVAETFYNDIIEFELEEVAAYYAAPGGNYSAQSDAGQKCYAKPGHYALITITPNKAPGEGQNVSVVLRKNGVEQHTPILWETGDSAEKTAVLNFDISSGDYLDYKGFQTIAGADEVYDFTIVLTGYQPNYKYLLNNGKASIDKIINNDRITKIQTADQTKNNSTAFISSTYLQAHLQGGHRYLIELFLLFSTYSNSDFKYQFTDTNSNYLYLKKEGDAANTAPTAINTAIAVDVGTNATFSTSAKGFYQCDGYDDDLIVQFAQNTAQANNTVLKKGSYLKITDLGKL